MLASGGSRLRPHALDSELDHTKGNVSGFGQTAPGDGNFAKEAHTFDDIVINGRPQGIALVIPINPTNL